MSDNPSLARRAALAVGLMIGFYVLALSIATGLVCLPYAVWAVVGRVFPKVAFFCIVGAGVIVWSIIPRIDRFVPPGPRLNPQEHPRLFQEIAAIAGALGQPTPQDVYIVSEVNAWVARRGGWMGLGSRPVMGLGLPLLSILKVSEFRAVLAHEFGHYHGGDTRLGPWVYKTRSTIGRTLQNLERHSSTLQKPFILYGVMFLRVTHAVSRAQEYAADALAARLFGSQAVISGLKTVHSAAPTFDFFWRTEASPVLNAGFLPPLSDGFQCFLGQQAIACVVAKTLDEELKEGKAEPYDTHPPLRDRIAALASLPPGKSQADEPLAIMLLENIPAVERQMLGAVAGEDAAAKLRSTDWDQLGKAVYLPHWSAKAQEQAKGLAGVTPAALGTGAKSMTDLTRHIIGLNEGALISDESIQTAQTAIACALAVALHKRGYEMRCAPGAPVSFHSGETSIEPFNMIAALVEDRMSVEEWQAKCAAFQVADVNLGSVVEVEQAQKA